MNRKQHQLMNLFTLTEKKKYSCEELSDLLQLGKRSITNYINEINSFLSGNDFEEIRLLPDNTYQLDVPLQELAKIRKKYFSQPLYEYHFSLDERITIIKLLLCKQNTVTTSDIMRSLDISKKTCLSDMKHVAKDLAQQDIPFLSAAKGYSIDVNEVFRRDYLINSFHTFLNVLGDNSPFSEISGIDLWISQYFHLELLKDRIFPILLNWQRENQINIEGYQFYQLLWILVVTADRIRQGYPISAYPCASDYSTIQISENLCSHLEKVLDLSFPAAEVYFLASYIDGLSLTSLPQMPLGTIPSNTVIHTFLVNVSRDLKLKLANDTKLYTQLSAHIKSFFSILERNTTFDRNFYKELEEEYPLICRSVKNNLYILEHSFHRTYKENEAAFLVMHIAAAVSKILAERQDFKVLVVCDSGTAMASYLMNKLKYFCKIDDIVTVSSFELHNYLRRINPAPNLIISLYPIDGISIPMVIVSPGLPSSDLSRIQEKMYASKKDENNLLKKRYGYTSHQTSYKIEASNSILDPGEIALDFEADTWQDALQLGGNLLMEEGIVTQNYIDSIIRNVEINGPYFVFWPGIALAHANTSSKSIPFQASLIRLKHPVFFHNDLNDPVRYIFTFIASDTPENDDKIVSIIHLASSPTLFQHLDHSKTPQEAFEIIRRTERDI